MYAASSMACVPREPTVSRTCSVRVGSSWLPDPSVDSLRDVPGAQGPIIPPSQPYEAGGQATITATSSTAGDILLTGLRPSRIAILASRPDGLLLNSVSVVARITGCHRARRTIQTFRGVPTAAHDLHVLRSTFRMLFYKLGVTFLSVSFLTLVSFRYSTQAQSGSGTVHNPVTNGFPRMPARDVSYGMRVPEGDQTSASRDAYRSAVGSVCRYLRRIGSLQNGNGTAFVGSVSCMRVAGGRRGYPRPSSM